MASALEKIMKGTLQRSDSQKAFSPWWEDFEDKLVYSLMILGMITLPFNMVSNTPVECTLDQHHPSFKNISVKAQRPMRYHHFYLRKFCTLHFIHDSMIFLPFVLILAPLPLVGVERMCLRFFQVVRRMDAFYKLLVKDSLDREDVEAMEKENTKNSHEILQMFRESNGIYYSQISKTTIQLSMGVAILAFLLWIEAFGLAKEELPCMVFAKHYVCVVPLANFYRHILVVAIAAIAAYVCSNVFNMLWLVYQRLSPFYRLMTHSYAYVDRCVSEERLGKMPRYFTRCLPNAETADEFFDVYFDPKGRDLGLLITLLACSNGVAEGLRFVSLFDKEYRSLWKPLNVRVYYDESDFEDEYGVGAEEATVHVEWDDAPIASFINNYSGRTGSMRVEYTLEIVPNSEAPLKNHLYRKNLLGPPEANNLKYKDSFYGVEREKPKRPKLLHQPLSIRASLTRMNSVDEGGGSNSNNNNNNGNNSKDTKTQEHKIIISTEVNGRTIAQRTEPIPPPVYRLQSPRARQQQQQQQRQFFDVDSIPV